MMGPTDTAPLLAHLTELRNRLLIAVLAMMVGFLLCWGFSEEIFAFLTRPLKDLMGPNDKMIFTGLHEAFFTYLKVSAFAGFVLALPVILTQVWLFVAPGLYESEKKSFLPFLLMTPALFFLGASMAYLFVFPMAFKYFLSFATPDIAAMPSISEYLGLIMTLMLAFGLVFEMPIALLLLIKTGAVSTKILVDKRKYNIVLSFVVAGIITPPDPISQIMLAVPMCLMYEIAILLGRGIERKRALETASTSDQETGE
ncbi:MAG: twin-arginine translocase subunit TatC [Magnetococcales bacterium]|nr:twin-arginine translocase subunit TatC [Magnetococcales bacterium]